MKPNCPLAGILPALTASLLLLAGTAFAEPVIATASTLPVPAGTATATDELAYQADVKSDDLLHGITGTGGTWLGNGSSPAGLNDGIHGGDYNASGLPALNGASWAADGNNVSFREFVLGNGANGTGFDLTAIQSIAAWNGAGFPNQYYTVSIRLVGGTTFSPLTTVNFQPFANVSTAGGSTKVTVTDSTGILARGVQAIRFDILDTISNNAGGVVMREIDVTGAATAAIPDETPPQVISLAPSNGANGILPGNNLVATFSEPIALGSGTITIKNLDTPSQTVITLPDARVSVSGAVLTIHPASDLATGTRHAIRIDPKAIDDLAGNSFSGIANDTTWAFRTGQPDLAAPTLVTLSPADNATKVPLASNLVATFSEPLALGTGTLTIKDLNTATQTVITLPDARVSVSGAMLTINPGSDFAPTTDYAVRIAAGAVTDLSGNPFAGIGDDSTWTFRSASAPMRIMCLGDSITTGYTDNPGWANHPFEFGYRSGLHTLLTQAGYNFLFVGGSTEPWTGISGDPTNGGAYTPPFDLRAIGQDGHRGYGGKAANFLNSNILSWLASDNPDLILLKIGTNSQDQAGLDTLVGTITTTLPATHLVIAQIMPRYTYHQGTVDYNSYIRNTLVPAYQAQGKKVALVDQYAPFLTNPAVLTSIDQSLFSNGINHPDNDGYDKMARVWFDGIEALGIGPATFDRWIADPDFGIAPGQRGLDDDPDGDGIENGVENHFGTHPGRFSQGLVASTKNGSTFTFTHPINATPAADLTAAYRWSKDLSTFTPDGTPVGGSTVRFTRGPAAGGWVTVTASVTGTPLDKLFVEVTVSRE